jgi:hypothetical protein
MSRRTYYWIPRTQVVRYADGRRVVTKRIGPRDWTRTNTGPDGRRTVTTSRTEPGWLGKLIWGGAGVLFVIIAPAKLFGGWSIPIYLFFAFSLFLRLRQWTNKRNSAAPAVSNRNARAGAPVGQVTRTAPQVPTPPSPPPEVPRESEPPPSRPSGRGAPGSGGMSRGSSRYDPLRRYLAHRTEPVVRLSFADIEGIIGGSLPASARRHRPWWANVRSGGHVHAAAWMGAGRRTANVDLNAGSVDFVR